MNSANALPLSKPPRGNTQNLSRGRVDQRPREGRVQRLARRLLIARDGPITTRELVDQAWPGERKLWHWVNAVRVIERYARRAGPRSRPLQWAPRPGVLGD